MLDPTRGSSAAVILLCLLAACVTTPQGGHGQQGNGGQSDAGPADAGRDADRPSEDAGPTQPDDAGEPEPVAVDARWEALAAGPIEAFIEAVDGAPEGELTALVEQLSGTPKEIAQLRLALLRLHRGASAILPQQVPPALAAPLAVARRLNAGRSTMTPGRVGLLLPMDRPWGPVLEAAFRLGLGEVELDMVVESSEAPELGVEKLIHEHGAALIVAGPFMERSQRAAVVAQRYGVPMISLSRDHETASMGDQIFQVGLSNRVQVEALVRGAMEQRGYRNFAILFPRTGAGWATAGAFKAAVEAAGGQVTREVPYASGETTFTGIINGMVGRDAESLNANPHFRRCLREIPDDLTGLRKKRQVEKCRDHTPPSLDFDAIFIADGIAAVRQIMPFIELADMVPNLNPRVLWRTRKATGNTTLAPTPILGLRHLNSRYFATRTRTDVEGALFVDAYYPYDSERALPGAFARTFRSRFKRAPDLLEILAYDLGLLVAHLAQNDGLVSRSIVRQNLAAIDGFDAVTGPWTMGSGGQVQRPLHLLSIHKRRIVSERDRAEAAAKKDD